MAPTNTITMITTTTNLILFLTLLSCCSAYELRGMLCSEHPLHEDYPDLMPELMRSWKFHPKKDGTMNWMESFYVPRYQGHSYNAPADSGDVARYHGLDIFVSKANQNSEPFDDYITIDFQRNATIFLILPDKVGTPTDIAGWTYEGKANLVETNGRAFFGIQRQVRFDFESDVNVFSKVAVDNTTTIPSLKKIAPNLQLDQRKDHFIILIAEHDGTASVRPDNNLEEDEEGNTPDIPPGGRCPDALHDLWKIQGHETDDEFTKDMWFRTYHPLWDPCYLCAYDHEHGSDVVRLMDYRPRFGYAALKNYEQDESHGGFKGIVMEVGKHLVYYQFHAHLSKAGRFTTRTHTVVIVVVDPTNDYAIEVELTYKQDFGFASVKRAQRAPRSGLLAVSDADQAIKDDMEVHGMKGSRQMNFHDKDNPDERFKFPSSRGTNEHWFSKPICSDVGHLRVDFKNPATGAVSGTDHTIVPLGFTRRGVFIQSTSNKRELAISTRKSWRLDHNLCAFTLDNIHGEDSHGFFYTDPEAIELYGETGNNRMKQYFKHDFSIVIAGTYNAVDTWAGLHKTNHKNGFMQDIGYAIDGSEN